MSACREPPKCVYYGKFVRNGVGFESTMKTYGALDEFHQSNLKMVGKDQDLRVFVMQD